MNEQKFKDFLRMLDNDLLVDLEVNRWNSSIFIDLPTELEDRTIIQFETNIENPENMELEKGIYKQWLEEVKAESLTNGSN